MKNSLSLLLTLSSVLLIAPACTQGRDTAPTTTSEAAPIESPSVAASPQQPQVMNPLAPSDGSPANSVGADDTSAEADTDTSGEPLVYREPSGLFEISLPSNYKYEETGSGIAFASGDEGFAGSVDYGSAQGQTLSNDDMEAALKVEYEERLDNVTWQGSEVQPDGSVRVDWVGTDPQGNRLDAVSFVEQRGDTIYILNLFGVNQAYQDYNSDAEVIVGSYRVRS